MGKVCSKCKIEKELGEFGVVENSKDGHRSSCKECNKLISKKYREKNKNILNEKYKKWVVSNPEKFKKSYNDYRKNNPKKIKSYYINNRDKILKYRNENFEKILIKKREYYQKNKEILLLENKKYKEKNKLKYLITKKKWIDNNRDNILKYKKNYYNLRKEKNNHIIAWRTILRNTLNRVGSKKENETNKLLGYSSIQLKEHIEKQFVDGMCWENWGKWHIDHIKPVSSFDKSEKMSIINSLDNLQPLWAADNLKKSNKIVN